MKLVHSVFTLGLAEYSFVAYLTHLEIKKNRERQSKSTEIQLLYNYKCCLQDELHPKFTDVSYI